MIDIPDAPWIRDAERYGVPEEERPCCPICGSDESDYFYVVDGEVVGCEACVSKIEVYDLIKREC